MAIEVGSLRLGRRRAIGGRGGSRHDGRWRFNGDGTRGAKIEEQSTGSEEGRGRQRGAAGEDALWLC